jgi:hypothetical protein
MRAIRNDGLDVFYNMDRYIPRPVNGWARIIYTRMLGRYGPNVCLTGNA